MKYRDDNGKVSEIQQEYEDAHQTTAKANILKERINTELGQLEEDFVLGVSATEINDRKAGIEKLIKNIKDLGRQCDQEMRRYQLVMRKYSNRG
jgi:hypothetical protein